MPVKSGFRIGPVSVLLAATSRHFAGAELLPRAKITLAQARSTALAARPGQATDEELEKDRGGAGLRYSFDIHEQRQDL